MKAHDVRRTRDEDDGTARRDGAGQAVLARLSESAGNAAVAALLERSSDAPSPALAVQRMYGSNVPCTFTTKKGSTYTVEAALVTRKPYYRNEAHSGQKNIFYCDKSTSDALLAASEATSGYQVQSQDPGTVRITFQFSNRPDASYVLQKSPGVGLYPVDMLLRPDGMPEAEDRFHVGHKITQIT